MHSKFLMFAILISAMAIAAEKPKSTGLPPAPKTWDELVDHFLKENYFHFHPTFGTSAGLHEYDSKLENASLKSINAEIASLRAFRSRFEDWDPNKLNSEQRGDRELLLNYANSTLLTLENIRPWE